MDAIRTQGEQSVETNRLDTVGDLDFFIGWIISLAGLIVGDIIGKGFGAVTVGLDIAYCLIGIRLPSC